MKISLLAALTLLIQRALGSPAMPEWAALAILPMVFVVGASLLQFDWRWTQLAILLGLGWDLILEPVIGPGGIAWSASALALSALAGIVADRSPRAWFAFGAAGAVVVIVVRWIALVPLGSTTALDWRNLLYSAVATAIWCGLAGWIRAIDVAARWRAYRARELR
jgi:hypothetical protein